MEVTIKRKSASYGLKELRKGESKTIEASYTNVYARTAQHDKKMGTLIICKRISDTETKITRIR